MAIITDVIREAIRIVKATNDEGALGFLTDLLQLQEKFLVNTKSPRAMISEY
ncbi:MAG: hypothetical protein MTP17_03405 [Candidatus Midichloria sp.]|nr:MAG: hypothetical protein MTP17_03405 [Candidatus Midichloria sp.]